MRLKITDLGPEYYASPSACEGSEVELAAPERQSRRGRDVSSGEAQDVLTVSDRTTCVACGGQRFETYLEQRAHFGTDLHKHNARRRAAGRPALNATEFDALAELLDSTSIGSISASDDGHSSEEDDDVQAAVARAERLAAAASVKVEFVDPTKADQFVLLYKVALPDLQSLASLAKRGGWAVVMSGGGHFAASIWDKAGNVVKQKTFHRYTSRAKQGGSQAAADSQGGKRIKSAGATLRRHGEQQLQNEVRSLLTSWREALEGVQCIYVRCNMRERRDLLTGWEGSPLAKFSEAGLFRTLPFPTRRATLKEVTRCYNELLTVETASESVIQKVVVPVTVKKAAPTTMPARPEQPKEKGTAHLKKRVEKPEPLKAENGVAEAKAAAAAAAAAAAVAVETPAPPIDEPTLALLKACTEGDTESLSSALCSAKPPFEKSVVFHSGYVKLVDAVAGAGDVSLGLVGAACVAGNVSSIAWLLSAGVPPAIGASPYLTTKSKAARTALRRHWAAHPDSADALAAAGVPGPLSDSAAEAAAAARKRARAKKKARRDVAEEAAKPADVRAREARAAAAERRLGGGVSLCSHCRTSLAGRVPFERLTYRYCSTVCVGQHKEALAADAAAARARQR